jgi:hypothetical protein
MAGAGAAWTSGLAIGQGWGKVKCQIEKRLHADTGCASAKKRRMARNDLIPAPFNPLSPTAGLYPREGAALEGLTRLPSQGTGERPPPASRECLGSPEDTLKERLPPDWKRVGATGGRPITAADCDRERLITAARSASTLPAFPGPACLGAPITAFPTPTRGRPQRI